MHQFNDTICAPATVPGAGAISIVRVSGPDALAIVDKVVRFRSGSASKSAAYRIRFGEIPDVDEVLVSIFRAPRSYTGEDSVEISCHASSFIVTSILELLVRNGVRMAAPGEFTQRAFVNGKMDLAQAEAVADIIQSRTEASHRVALNQLKGAYSSELRKLRDKLLELTVLLELELDFSEEEVEFADREKLRSLLDETTAHIKSLSESFKAGNAIKNGVPVAIVGAVNSGKSTLLNALLGEERAIVSDIAGTTRDTIEETMVLDGVLYRFIDTAGLRSTSDYVEKIGIERALSAARKAEVVIEVIDASSPALSASAFPGHSPSASSSHFPSPMDFEPEDWQTLIRVSNKTDIAPAIPGTVGISARDGSGLDELRKLISGSRKAMASGTATLVTNLRHYEALIRALESLDSAKRGIISTLPSDLIAEDLRAAISELNSIFGEQIGTEDVLSEIFGRFCIGK